MTKGIFIFLHYEYFVPRTNIGKGIRCSVLRNSYKARISSGIGLLPPMSEMPIPSGEEGRRKGERKKKSKERGGGSGREIGRLCLMGVAWGQGKGGLAVGWLLTIKM